MVVKNNTTITFLGYKESLQVLPPKFKLVLVTSFGGLVRQVVLVKNERRAGTICYQVVEYKVQYKCYQDLGAL